MEMWLSVLQGTFEVGMLFHPKMNEAFKVYADADFSDNCLKEYAEYDQATTKSRLGWIITYANGPILWAPKMQSLVILSTTEAEYIALSSALQEAIPLMEFAK